MFGTLRFLSDLYGRSVLKSHHPYLRTWDGVVKLTFEPGAEASLSISGSDQARKGRLVDALAVRGDEGRDTLR
jgi:hypothetical protein